MSNQTSEIILKYDQTTLRRKYGDPSVPDRKLAHFNSLEINSERQNDLAFHLGQGLPPRTDDIQLFLVPNSFGIHLFV